MVEELTPADPSLLISLTRKEKGLTALTAQYVTIFLMISSVNWGCADTGRQTRLPRSLKGTVPFSLTRKSGQSPEKISMKRHKTPQKGSIRC